MTLTKSEATRLSRGASAFEAITGQRIKTLETIPADRSAVRALIDMDVPSFCVQIKALLPSLDHPEVSALYEQLADLQHAVGRRHDESYPQPTKSAVNDDPVENDELPVDVEAAVEAAREAVYEAALERLAPQQRAALEAWASRNGD